MQTISFTPITSLTLTLPEFLDLKKGDLLVSPQGGIFAFGEIAQEFVPSGHDTDETESKEFHFYDDLNSLRKIEFVAGTSLYGILISDCGKVEYTSGIQKKIGKDYDEEWNFSVDAELGWVD